MLIDAKGRQVNPENLPKGKAKREAVLATLREAPSPWRGHGKDFTLAKRARLREARQ